MAQTQECFTPWSSPSSTPLSIVKQNKRSILKILNLGIKFSKKDNKLPRVELMDMGKVSAMGIRPADLPASPLPLPLLSLRQWLPEVALEGDKRGLFGLKGRLL